MRAPDMREPSLASVEGGVDPVTLEYGTRWASRWERFRPARCRPVIWWGFVGFIGLLIITPLLAACLWVLWFTVFEQFHP